jgi:hypothetical protein
MDGALIKAIARAFSWRDLLEQGTYGTITELAEAERIDHSYVGRILRLTLLAPVIIDAILHGRQPATVTLADVLQPLAQDWDVQGPVLRQAVEHQQWRSASGGGRLHTQRGTHPAGHSALPCAHSAD